MVSFFVVRFSLVDINTFYGDLHTANSKGSIEWKLEYSFREFFDMKVCRA